MEHPSKSPFARALDRALKESTSSREDWARILGVTASAISQWVNDETAPRAETLRSLWTTLLEDTRVSDEALESFNRALCMPATKASPRGERVGPSFRHYMITPLRDAFLETLETLAPHDQELLLLEAGQHARRLRREARTAPSVTRHRAALLDDLVDQEVAGLEAGATSSTTPNVETVSNLVLAINQVMGCDLVEIRKDARYWFVSGAGETAANVGRTGSRSSPSRDSAVAMRTERPVPSAGRTRGSKSEAPKST